MSIRKGDNLIAGSVNYDAALESYTKDVELGKREIAQALIDKGADVTANSSLIEMADATKDLVLQDGSEWIITKGGVNKETNVNVFGNGSASILSKLTILFYEDMKNLIFYNGTFYFVENGEYENVDDMMSKAVATHVFQDWIDNYSTLNSPTMVYSKDKTKLAVNVNTNVFYIFEVNWQTHTMSEITHFTTSSQDGDTYYISKFAINNSATVLAYHNTRYGSSGEYAIFFWSITKGEQYRYNQGDCYQVPFVFLEENKLLSGHSSSSEDRNIHIINFNISEDGTLSKFNTTNTNFGVDDEGNEIRASYNFEINKFIGVSKSFPNTFEKYNYFNLFIIDAINGTKCSKKIKIIYKDSSSQKNNPFSISTYRLQSYALNIYATYFRLLNIGNGKYKFIDPLLEQINVIYDSTKNEITSDYDYFLPHCTLDEYDNGSNNSGTAWRTICKNNKGEHLEAGMRNMYFKIYPIFKYTNFNLYSRIVETNDNEYKVALKIKNNGRDYLVTATNISNNNLDFFSKETTKIEL